MYKISFEVFVKLIIAEGYILFPYFLAKNIIDESINNLKIAFFYS